MKKLFTAVITFICATFYSGVNANQYNPSYSEQCACQFERSGGRFYVGGFGGADWLNTDRVLHTHRMKVNTGYVAGGSVGYQFQNGFRIEGEVSYRHFDAKRHQKLGLFNVKKTEGYSYSWSYMGNAFYDFNGFTNYVSNVVPYVGFGLGYTQNHAKFSLHFDEPRGHNILDINGYTTKTTFKGRADGFVYQGIAGVGYKITKSTILGVEYRYFGGKRGDNIQGVTLALRQSF